MTLCYYVTGHGFGHTIRTCQILKELPADIDVIVRTTASETVFREELPKREFRYIRGEFDCGCLQSDSVTVLEAETLERYREISARSHAELNEEIAFLKSEGVSCVFSDTGAFPLYAAREAGIPSFAVVNFTWHDIYNEYVRTDQDRELLAQMAREYAAATQALVTPLATPTVENVFSAIEHVPVVARRGANVRERLSALLPPNAGPNFALLYFGVWGLDLNWKALEQYRDWTFFTYDAPPISVKNVVVLERSEWFYADAAASVNAVVTKPGYGTVTECIANGVPLIYVPRTAFIEYDALVAGLNKWGGGIPMTIADFAKGAWSNALDGALRAQLNADAFATNGASVVAEKIVSLLK